MAEETNEQNVAEKETQTTEPAATPENAAASDAAENAQTECETPAEEPAADVDDGTEASGSPETPAADESVKDENATDETASAEETPKAEEPAADVDWKLQCARVMADFDNFRKRTARDREDLVKAASADVIKDVLKTVDNLSLALDKAKDKADDPFVQGVRLVYDELIKTLAQHGATPLDSLGEPFNADFHDALATLPSPDVEADHVMNEVKRGWLLHGKLLRAAQVVVSSGKQA